MKMKKKILSAAVLAALGSGGAQAVNIGQNGTGEVLLFPYYTVQGNEETLLSVVNTTSQGKIVKIRFREAYNSREVLDFNIYMSPWDVWTGKVLDYGDGAGIVTYDNSCTVPQMSAGVTVPFRPYNYDGSKASDGFPQDGAPTGIERTREGYVEIIEMGVPDDTLSVWDNNDDGKLDYVHESGVPNYCQGMTNNWNGGFWATSANDGVSAPTGGLFGSLAIINVQSGAEVAVAATPLDNVFEDAQHADPGDENPTLEAAYPASTVLDPNGDYLSVDAIQSDWIFGEDAVSAVLMATAVINEYSVNPAVEAESAWIVTFPTKWAYVDYVNNAVFDPFAQSFYKDNDSDGNPVGRGQSCDSVDAIAYDREEFKETQDLDFSPRPPGGGFQLCYEANVIQFGDSNVFSAENTVSRLNNPPGKNGWMKLGLVDDPTTNYLEDNGGYTYEGLPVIGFKATVLGNSNVGVGASYGAAVAHAYERSIHS